MPIAFPSEPAEGESDPHKEPEPATVKGECRVAVCLSMLIPTTYMRRGDADMLHHSLPTLTTANVSLVCLYFSIQHILDHHDCTVARECGYLHSVMCVYSCMHVNVCVCVFVACVCGGGGVSFSKSYFSQRLHVVTPGQLFPLRFSWIKLTLQLLDTRGIKHRVPIRWHHLDHARTAPLQRHCTPLRVSHH